MTQYVYLVTQEPYHETSEVLGVYSTLEAAKASVPGSWEHEGYYVAHWEHCVAECIETVNHQTSLHLIRKLEVQL